MYYREYPPPPQLANHVQCFWALEHDYRDPLHTHEHLWADAQIELIFSFGERYYRLAGDEQSILPKNFVGQPVTGQAEPHLEILGNWFSRQPKMFARIVRFNHAKRLIELDPGISLSSLTYETGYTDQAHFSRNFRELFGYAPAGFKAQYLQASKNSLL